MALAAGTGTIRPLRAIDEHSVQDTLRLNVETALFFLKGIGRRHVANPAGASVVLISSVMGAVGQAGRCVYGASKGAVEALCKSAALELASRRIRVNCVAPGFVDTAMTRRDRALLTPDQFAEIERMHPLGIGRPEHVAGVAAFLLSEVSQWMTGTTVVVDGGYTSH